MSSLFPELNKYKLTRNAPLPFMGQKRNFLDIFRRILMQKTIDKDVVFLDAFGGSGLLAHNLKIWYPDNEVVWNDYDNYQKRLDTIHITNEIKDELKTTFDFKTMPQKIPAEIKEQILNILLKYIHKYGEDKIDFITLSSYFLFSGEYAVTFSEFSKKCFYNQFSFNTLNADNYLVGVKTESLDFKELFAKYANTPTLLVLNPPYLQTQKGNYKSFFRLRESKNLYFARFTSAMWARATFAPYAHHNNAKKSKKMWKIENSSLGVSSPKR